MGKHMGRMLEIDREEIYVAWCKEKHFTAVASTAETAVQMVVSKGGMRSTTEVFRVRNDQGRWHPPVEAEPQDFPEWLRVR